MKTRTALLLLLAAVVPRMIALAIWPGGPPTLYLDLAVSLARDHAYTIDGIRITHIEPGYPLALAAGLILSGGRVLIVRILQAAIAGIGAPLVFVVAERHTADRRSAWVAGLLYAASPYLIRQAAAFMEVTAAVVVVLAAAWLLPHAARVRVAVLLGAVLAAILLTRFSLAPVVAIGLVILAARYGPARMAAATAAMALCLTPWILYARHADGSWLPPRVGENLYVSTSAAAWGVVPRANVDLLVPLADRAAGRILAARGLPLSDTRQRDHALLGLALDYARAHPARAAALKLRNLAYLFQPRLLPFGEKSGLAVMQDGVVTIPPQRPRPLLFEIAADAFQAILLSAGLTGLWRRRRRLRDDAFLIGTIAGVAAVNVVFFPTSRLLAPMTPMLMIYAGAAVGARHRISPS